MSQNLEDFIPVVKYAGLNTEKDVTINANLTVTGTTTIAAQTLTDLTTTGNTILGNAVTDTTAITGATTITSTSASALTVGANGATNPVIKVVASTASVATGISVTGAAAAGGVAIAAISSGTNEAVTLAGKGTGPVQLGQSTSTDVRLVADQPIADSSGNELIKFVKTASAVNELTVTNAATGGLPTLTGSGGDTHVSIAIAGKGDGAVAVRSFAFAKQGTPTAKTVSATLSAAELASGIITVNQAGAGTSAQQLPTASDLDTLLAMSAANDSFEFSVINTSTVDAEDASVTTNTGWTLVGNMDIHAYSAAGSLNSSGRFLARKTGAGAWTLYRIS